MMTIVVFSGAVLGGGVDAGHAKAEGGVAAPFGPALLRATLAVIGIGAARNDPDPSTARRAAPPNASGAAASRARPERGAAAGARRAMAAASAEQADLAR